MSTIVQLLTIAAALGVAYGDVVYNVSSPQQDYFRLSQRELLHQIEIATFQVNAVETRYADRLNVIQFQQQQVLNDIQQVNQTLVPQQALNLIRKHCIQKYVPQFMTYDNATVQLKYCYDKAQLPSLTTSAMQQVTRAKNYVLNQMPRCVTTNCNFTNQTKNEECYISCVDTGSRYVQDYLKAADTELDRSVYNSVVTSQTAVQCTWNVQKIALVSTYVSWNEIDRCQMNLNNKKVVPTSASVSKRN